MSLNACLSIFTCRRGIFLHFFFCIMIVYQGLNFLIGSVFSVFKGRVAITL